MIEYKKMHGLNCIADSFQGTSHVENQDGFLVVDEQDYMLLFVFDGVSLSLHPRKGVEIAMQYISNNHMHFYENTTYDLTGLMYGVQESIMQSTWENALTTYCAVCIVHKDSKFLIISNLGDSRIYIIEQDEIISVSTDDTMYPGSNILTKCLGIKDLARTDFREEKIQWYNQKILLCSDGFYSLLLKHKSEFNQIFNMHKIKHIKKLFKEIIEGNNFDDSSYVYAISNEEDKREKIKVKR